MCVTYLGLNFHVCDIFRFSTDSEDAGVNFHVCDVLDNNWMEAHPARFQDA